MMTEIRELKTIKKTNEITSELSISMAQDSGCTKGPERTN